MASVTSFIRNMPASSLQAYFHHTGIELPTEVDWEAPEPEVVRVTLRAVDEMDDEARARIVNDADRVGALADDAGQTALYTRMFHQGMASAGFRGPWARLIGISRAG